MRSLLRKLADPTSGEFFVLYLLTSTVLIGATYLYSTTPRDERNVWIGVALILYAAMELMLTIFLIWRTLTSDTGKVDHLLEEAKEIIDEPALSTRFAQFQLPPHLLPLQSDTQLRRRRISLDLEDELQLVHLWRQNQRLLNVYHRVAEAQAKGGFKAALFASFVGLLLVGGSVVSAALATTVWGGIAAGSVGVVATAIAGYIAATYLKLQQSTSEQMRSYFEQPVELSRALTAERLLSKLEGPAREEATSQIISALMRDRAPTSESHTDASA